MSRRRVAKGKAAREQRYESAVRRQIGLIDGTIPRRLPATYLYAPAEEFVRYGDQLVMFTEDGR